MHVWVSVRHIQYVKLGRGSGLVWLDNSVAIRLQHLPSDVFSPGILNGARDARISAFTLLNMTFDRACTRKKKDGGTCVHVCLQRTDVHRHTATHFTEAV